MEGAGARILQEGWVELRGSLPELVECLRLEEYGLSAWTSAIDRKLLTRLSPEFPLIAAVCGGGSSGKSTLFNSLNALPLSPVGGAAGMSRRVLVSIGEERLDSPETLAPLFAAFGCLPGPLRNPDELGEPGPPLYVPSGNLPRNLVLLDTPDFDTGARGAYANREAAAKALEAADVLIYIFTNSNYNNRDNTDFIARMLTGIGIRKSFLVYRVYPSFTEGEVFSHAMTVARNIYGAAAGEHILGIYRADEENEVAAGRKEMELRRVGGGPSLHEALGKIDPRRLRVELLASILKGAAAYAREALARARVSRDALSVYPDALRAAQSRSVQETLRHFPIDLVMKRFAQIWLATDPLHIRLMRRTGAMIDLPVRGLLKTVRWTIGKISSDEKPAPASPAKTAEAEFEKRFEENLVHGANRLRNAAVESEIGVTLSAGDPAAERIVKTLERIRAETGESRVFAVGATGERGAMQISVPAHPAVRAAQEKLKERDWNAALSEILSRKEAIVSFSGRVEKELTELAGYFRARMGIWSKVRQTFSAFLNILPATAAVTYILSTGDPIGGAGIKVKLYGLFGLNDLYALIALPATTGLKQADRTQLETLLVPVAQTWLNDKLKTLQALFEQEVTGDILNAAHEALDTADRLIARIEAALAVCEKESAFE